MQATARRYATQPFSPLKIDFCWPGAIKRYVDIGCHPGMINCSWLPSRANRIPQSAINDVSAQEKTMFAKLAIRDLAVVALCIGCWMLEAQLREAGGALHWLLIAAAAVMTFLVNYFCHEWGHLLGTRLAGSVYHPANTLKTFYLFHFDTQHNSVRQFLAMAAGGLIASTVLLPFWWVVLPLHTVAGIAAMVLIVLGYLATLATELPVAWRIARGAQLPHGKLFEPMA
jgi:hypothetical protein